MKRKFLILLASAAFSFQLNATSSKETLPTITAEETYEIDSNNLLQPFEGWGSSLCWWARMCGTWSEGKLDEIIDWLVSPEGLNMSIFRYNIGGGDDPQNTHCEPHHMGKGKGLRAEMEGFQDFAGGPYIWERDAAQRRVMLKIREKRPDAIFEAFSNSAPWWMTISGCCGGAVKATDDNLNPAFYDAFAHYLVDVCKHYKDVYGLEFRTLAPFNEPNTDYWYANGSQEGCHFNPSTQADFLRVLHPILKASGLSTVISTSDETDVSLEVEEIELFRREGLLPYIGQFNTHTYRVNDKSRLDYRRLGEETGKRIWQSEVGGGGQGIQGNLTLAQKMFDDLNLMRPAAWLDWQYVEEHGDQWSLVTSSFSDESTAIRNKNYYVRQQVTKYISPGSRFIPSPCRQSIAAVDPSGKKLTLVLLNPTEETKRHHITLKGSLFKGKPFCRYTDKNHNGVPCPHKTVRRKGNSIQATLPPLSITTLQIELKRSIK